MHLSSPMWHPINIRVFQIQEEQGMVSTKELETDPQLQTIPNLQREILKLLREGLLIEVSPGYVRTSQPPIDRYADLKWYKRTPTSVKRDPITGAKLPPEDYYMTYASECGKTPLYQDLAQAIGMSGSYKVEKEGFKYFWINSGKPEKNGGIARRPLFETNLHKKEDNTK